MNQIHVLRIDALEFIVSPLYHLKIQSIVEIRFSSIQEAFPIIHISENLSVSATV